MLSNTVSITLSQGTDPTTGDHSATDSDAVVALADLFVSKDNGLTEVVPGTEVTYTVTVSNRGPSRAPVVTVSDTMPPQLLTPVAWTCTPAGGASCAPVGIGDINDAVSLPVSSSLVYTIIGIVDPAASGNISNTASAMVGGGVSDPNLSNNIDGDSDPLIGADLSITKSDSADPAVAGTELVYTITVFNPNPVAIHNVVVTESLPTGVSFVATNGCAEDGSGGGVPTCNLGTIAAGGSKQYTVRVLVQSHVLGSIVNTAVVSSPLVDPNPDNDSIDEATEVVAEADLQAAKSNARSWLAPGEDVTYLLEIANAGPSDAAAADVSDDMPVELVGTGWTCVATGGAFCSPSGTGNLLLDTVEIPVGERVTYTVTTTVDAGTPLGTDISYTVEVVPTGGLIDPNTANNSATDNDPVANQTIFSDGFESGDTTAWAIAVEGSE